MVYLLLLAIWGIEIAVGLWGVIAFWGTAWSIVSLITIVLNIQIFLLCLVDRGRECQ